MEAVESLLQNSIHCRMSIECVIKRAATTFGESPHWDGITNTLLYVDILANTIHRFHPDTGVDKKNVLDDTVTFVVPARKGGLIVGLGLSLAHVDWESKNVTRLHTVQATVPGTKFNDGKCDPIGRIYAGLMGPAEPDFISTPRIGGLFCLDIDGSLRKCVDNVGISNGLAWTKDGKVMFHIDSAPRQVYRYDYEITSGRMSNKRVIVDHSDKPVTDYGLPDGMTTDTEGKLWIAGHMSSKVFRHDPDTGELLQSVEFPARRITSCCFGGKNFDELYVTSSAFEIPEDEMEAYPLSGSVFKVTGLGVKGFSPNVYEGEITPLKI